MSQALEKAHSPCLSLSPMCSPFAEVKAYIQGNTLASRKKVMPIIKDCLKDWEIRAVHCGTLEDLGDLEDQFSSSCSPVTDHDSERHTASQRCRLAAEDCGTEEDSFVPPTPMNSLVEGCPLDRGLPRVSAEAVLERFREVADEVCTEDRPPHGQ